VLFVVAFSFTVAYVAFGVWVSGPWRDQLHQAIGPVMAWVIPLCVAYIPGVVIGFMVATLLFFGRYRERPVGPPSGDWPEGGWPAVTVVIAAWNEEEAIVSTLERIAELSYQGRSRSSRPRSPWRSGAGG
jgi:poly-beta-1,6-N-acetyl-D-glucosamine synthase